VIRSGNNFIRVVRLERGQKLIYDIYKFVLFDINGDTYPLGFLSPAGVRPAQIIRDLMILERSKEWRVFEMIEKKQGILSVKQIREPEMAQEEISKLAFAHKSN